jgi:protein-S-isoprenylcysteine O-methyltransferase
MENSAFAMAGFVGLVIYSLAEPLMRRGRARSMQRGPFDRGSTTLVSGLAVLIIAGSIASHFAWSPGVSRLPTWVCVGFLLGFAFATTLRFWSMWVLGEFFTRTLKVSAKQVVVRAGPYRWIRHPGYLAQLLAVSAFAALLSQSWWGPLIAWPALGAAYVYRIGAEEEMLASALGSAYREYQARTWRLLPGLY